MPVRQFWRHIKHRLLYANLLVYSLITVLLLAFYNEIDWGQKALRVYILSGSLDPTADNLLVKQATEHLKTGGDPVYTQRLLEEALDIDPYTRAHLLLGICHLRQDQEEKMLECYDKYRTIDPSVAIVYLQMINVLEKRKDYKAIEKLLTEGIEHFQKRIELYEPQVDPTVPERFNRKAVELHNTAKISLETLKQKQKVLSNPQK